MSKCWWANTELQREANSILLKNNKDDDLAEDPFGTTSSGNLRCMCFLRASQGCDVCLCQLSILAILGMIKAHQNSSSLFLYRTTTTQIIVLAARLVVVKKHVSTAMLSLLNR